MSERDDERSRLQHDDLEYNDGLGDLLREKEQFEFSWLKTLVSVLVIILALYIGVTVLFKFAKSMVEKPNTSVSLSEETTTPTNQDMLVDEILATPSATYATPTTNPTLVPTPAAVQAPLPVKPLPQASPKTKSPKPAPTPLPAPTPAPAPKPLPTVTKPVDKRAAAPAPLKAQPKKIERHVPQPQAQAPVATSTGVTFKVIAGSFITRSNADVLKEQLAKKGVEAYIWTTTDQHQESVYRVQVGSFKSKDVAQRLQSELSAKGVETYIQSL